MGHHMDLPGFRFLPVQGLLDNMPGTPIVGGPVMLEMVRSPLLSAGLWQRPGQGIVTGQGL